VVAIVLLAVVAAVFLMTSGGDDGTTETETAGLQGGDGGVVPTPVTEDIVVAKQDIPRGALITEDYLAIRPWPVDALPADSWNYYRASQFEEVVGLIARTTIYRNMPILGLDVVEDFAGLAPTGSDAAAIITSLPEGTVAVAVPLDPSGIGQVAYGISDGDAVDVILSFLFVDVDPTFQTRLPNNISVITMIAETGELTIGAPRQGRPEPSAIAQIGGTGAVLVGPSEPSQRPRLVTARTVTNAYVVHVGYFPEGGRFIGLTPTPLPEATGVAPTPGSDQPQQQQQQQAAPAPTATLFTPLIITLAVSPQDALVLTWAVDAQIPITLVLRQAGDDSFSDPDPVTLDYMITHYRATPPNALEVALEPPITSVRRFDIGTLFDFLAGAVTTE
jgi:Flp pilus assembly protein CpaB